jgi:short-subunit dehydrogenase
VSYDVSIDSFWYTHTMRAKRSGRIINISSMGGKIYTPLGS